MTEYLRRVEVTDYNGEKWPGFFHQFMMPAVDQLFAVVEDERGCVFTITSDRVRFVAPPVYEDEPSTTMAAQRALRAAPMPRRESTIPDDEVWHEAYSDWWHANASEAALARLFGPTTHVVETIQEPT